jgi:hypothetical protein
VWGKDRGSRWRDSHQHRPGVAASHPPHSRLGRRDVVQDHLRTAEQFDPGTGQVHPPRRAFEQRRTKLSFQPPHELTQRRLRQVQPICRASEVQLRGQRHERLELT